MIETKFRPTKLDKGTIFKFTSEDLVKERNACENFLNKTFSRERIENLKLVAQLKDSLKRAENSLIILTSMSERSSTNLGIINEMLPKVINAEIEKEHKKEKKKKAKRKVRSIYDEEQDLLQRLAEIQQLKGAA